MEARVKATGEIVEVKCKVVTSMVTGKDILKYIDQNTGVSYFENELDFPKGLTDDPDYWTRLEHQYAGMAMQGMMSNISFMKISEDAIACVERVKDITARMAIEYAHALVEKMKEERK